MTLTKSAAAALLNGDRVKLTDCQGENDKPCNAMIFLEDNGKEANIRLKFQKQEKSPERAGTGFAGMKKSKEGTSFAR